MQTRRHFASSNAARIVAIGRWISFSALLGSALPGCAEAGKIAGDGESSGGLAGVTTILPSGGDSGYTGGATTGGTGSGGLLGEGGAIGRGGDGNGGALGPGGAPPANGGAPGQGGSAGAGESSCVSGVDTGDPCNPAVDVDVCHRSNRDCVCGAARSWTCTTTDGAGGSGAGGAPVGNGGKQEGGAETDGGEAGSGDAGSPGRGGAASLPKFVGNITTGWNAALDTNGLTYSDYWDQVTAENAGKWGSVQGSPSSTMGWGTLDSIHDYTTSSGIIFKHHCFLWGAQQPEPQSQITESHVKDWMNAFCERYPDTAIIDVVNEPPPHTNPGYVNAIGGGTNGDWKWISNAFKWAREACPNSILLLNDYNNIEWPNDHQHFIDIVKAIQADGAPIDAIGCQAHDLDHGSVSSSSAKSMIAALHDETGLPIYITEFDISTTDDQAQLSKYQDYFPFFMETEYIHGITIWGWIFGSTWSMAPDSGLVRNGSPRSAMTWLMEELGRPVP